MFKIILREWNGNSRTKHISKNHRKGEFNNEYDIRLNLTDESEDSLKKYFFKRYKIDETLGDAKGIAWDSINIWINKVPGREVKGSKYWYIWSDNGLSIFQKWLNSSNYRLKVLYETQAG